MGWRLGRYRVDERPFASGATAEVFAARKGRAGPRVAIKLLPLRTYRERAEAEADHGRIEHPHLLTVHERVVDERRGVVGLVMDLATDGDLRNALRGPDAPTPAEMVQIADDVLSALEALHAVGIVHRDVKPENILLERVDGKLRARLGDLGIARPVDRTRSTGSVLGTDLYIAPEVHDGSAPSAAADLWALGYVLYEGLFGAPPHANAATTYQAIGRLRAEGPDRPPNVPDSVWAVVSELLAPSPSNRPRSAHAARALLASARPAAEAASVHRLARVVQPQSRKRSAGYRRVASVPRRAVGAWTRRAVATASVTLLAGGLWVTQADSWFGDATDDARTVAVTPLSADAPDVVPTQYQWVVRGGVLRGRLDLSNTSSDATPATTMPELFPARATNAGRLALDDFDGVQEKQRDGSVLVRFSVPPLAAHAHHLITFSLRLSSRGALDLAALVREREAAINRHAFALSDAPTLERIAVSVSSASLTVGDATAINVIGALHDGGAAPATLLKDVRYQVVVGEGVVRLEGGSVRALAPGTATVRAVIGALHADTNVVVHSPPAPPVTKAKSTPRRPASTQPPTTQAPSTEDEPESVVF